MVISESASDGACGQLRSVHSLSAAAKGRASTSPADTWAARSAASLAVTRTGRPLAYRLSTATAAAKSSSATVGVLVNVLDEVEAESHRRLRRSAPRLSPLRVPYPLEAAQRVDASGPSAEQQSRFLLDVARSWAVSRPGWRSSKPARSDYCSAPSSPDVPTPAGRSSWPTWASRRTLCRSPSSRPGSSRRRYRRLQSRPRWPRLPQPRLADLRPGRHPARCAGPRHFVRLAPVPGRHAPRLRFHPARGERLGPAGAAVGRGGRGGRGLRRNCRHAGRPPLPGHGQRGQLPHTGAHRQ